MLKTYSETVSEVYYGKRHLLFTPSKYSASLQIHVSHYSWEAFGTAHCCLCLTSHGCLNVLNRLKTSTSHGHLTLGIARDHMVPDLVNKVDEATMEDFSEPAFPFDGTEQ